MIKTVLIDQRTPEGVIETALRELASCTKYGVDCETENSQAHEGIKEISKRKLIFDHRRATMTGFSWYVDDSDTAYYVNLNHADVENRMPDSFVYLWHQHVPKEAMGISHNAPYELTTFKMRYNLRLDNLVCSMQLAVTHHGPDNYDLNKFYQESLSNIRPIMDDILTEFASYDASKHGRNLTSSQAFVYGQWAGKSTKASHSYNGFVDKVAYSFGLKKLVKQIFNYDMSTFKEVLGDKEHMGQLTGDEAAVYGAEDAYWCVQVFNWLYNDLLKNNPKVLVTFFKQENPMIYVYSEAAVEGLELNVDAIYERQALERENVAQLLREIKAALKDRYL